MNDNELIISQIHQHFGINIQPLLAIGLIDIKTARRCLIRHLYYQHAKQNRTYTDIKLDLSVQYNISVSSIEKLIYRK